MLWGNLLLVIILAVIFSGLLVGAFSWRHPAAGDALGVSFLFLFIVLFFAIWAGGVWLPPWGPLMLGTSWVLFVLIGLFISLLILAIAAPVRRPRTRIEAVEQAREEEAVGTVFGVFFWVLIAGMLIAALISYL